MKPDGKAWRKGLKKVPGKIIHSHDILGILFPHLIYQSIPYIRVLRRCRSDPLGWVNFDSHFHHFQFIVWVETFKKMLQNLFVPRYRQLEPVCLHDDSYSEAIALVRELSHCINILLEMRPPVVHKILTVILMCVWECWVCESVCDVALADAIAQREPSWKRICSVALLK